MASAFADAFASCTLQFTLPLAGRSDAVAAGEGPRRA